MKNNPKISYEPEADVLRVEMSQKPIDHAREIGNFIVHFSKDNLPVYIEILEAVKFQKVAKQALKQPAMAIPF